MPDPTYDAIIIGAGLSGLAAAQSLLDLHPDAKVLVLEARDRAGGRVLTKEPEYGYLDMGGEFIGLIQEYAPFYALRFGLPTHATFLAKTHRWRFQDESGAISDFPGNDPHNFPGGDNALNALGALDQLALTVRTNLEAPWETPNAVALDNMRAVDLLPLIERLTKTPLTKVTRDIFRVSVRSAFSVEPEDISALFCLYYAAAAGSYSTLVDINGGGSEGASEGAAEGTRFQLGADSLVQAFLEALGERVVFGELVEAIDQTGGKCATVSTRTKSYTARFVIVAMSPPIAGNIAYQPTESVSPERRDLFAGMFMGHTIKAFFAYNRAFWRQAGLMGYALAASPVDTHPIDWTLDNCFEGLGPVPPHPHSLMVFMAGKAANIWGPKTPRERYDAALSQLVEIFGPEAESELLSGVTNYHEFDFKTEVLSGGGPTAVMPPGLLTTSGKVLRLPDGLIHWAGTEHATNWCGYMDGAIQAGIRAAGAVYNRLTSPVQESASFIP